MRMPPIFTKVLRVRIVIETDEGVVGWDIGHPEDMPGETTVTLRTHAEVPVSLFVDDRRPRHETTFEVHTTGGYRRITLDDIEPQHPGIEAPQAISGIVDGELMD